MSMRDTLFDRERERWEIKKFLDSPNENVLLVSGPSGTGKSYLIQYCLSEHFASSGAFLSFSFRDATPSDAPFSQYIQRTYQQLRKQSSTARKLLDPMTERANLDGFLISIPFGPSMQYSINWKKEIDSTYVAQFFRTMTKINISALHVANLEWLDGPDDEHVLREFLSAAVVPIKIILECGSLRSPSNNANRVLQKFNQKNTSYVAPFNRNISEQMFKDLYNTVPPNDLLEKTGGTALLIKHYFDSTGKWTDIDLIKDVVESLSQEGLELVRLLDILGGDTKVEYLSRFFSASNFDALLEYLRISKKIVDISEDRVQFSHAAYTKYLRQFSNSYLDNRVRKRVVAHAKDNIPTSPEEMLFVAHHARLVNYTEDFVYFAERANTLGYLKQDFRSAADAARELLESDHVPSAVCVISLAQSLLILGEFDDAERIVHDYHYAFFGDPTLQEKASLLYGEILHERCFFQKSIETVEGELFSSNQTIAAIAFGVQCANFLSTGQINRARESHASAWQIARRSGNIHLIGELARLAPKVNGRSHGIAQLTDFIDCAESADFPFLRVKCLHNRATAKIHAWAGHGADNDLMAVQTYFEEVDSPLLGYVLVAKGALELLRFQYEEAEMILRDAINVSFLPYDKFCARNALAVLAILREYNWDAVWYWLDEAERTLGDFGKGYGDPEMNYVCFFNKALACILQGKWQKADEFVVGLELPPSMREISENRKWHAELERCLRNRVQPDRLHYESTEPTEHWPDQILFLHLPYVHFFDFSIPVLSRQDFKVEIQELGYLLGEDQNLRLN